MTKTSREIIRDIIQIIEGHPQNLTPDMIYELTTEHFVISGRMDVIFKDAFLKQLKEYREGMEE